MTEELQELGLEVGHRRVGRLMAENGMKVVRTRKYKATTDSNHAFAVAPNLLDRDFSVNAPNQKWAGDIQSCFRSGAEPAGPGFLGQRPQSEMGRRHQLHLDRRRLALPGRHSRPLLPARDRLGCQRRRQGAFTTPIAAVSTARAIIRNA
jgi:transposase InsO family protein